MVRIRRLSIAFFPVVALTVTMLTGVFFDSVGEDGGGSQHWEFMGVVNKPGRVEGGQRFGWSTSVDKNTMVVGAPGASANTGAAYVYMQTMCPAADESYGGQGGDIQKTTKRKKIWTLVATLSPSDLSVNNHFGRAVSVSGDSLFIGAHFQDIGGISNAGAVYVYSRAADGMSWRLVRKYTGRKENGYFGISVSVDGESGRAVAGNYEYRHQVIIMREVTRFDHFNIFQ